MALLRSNHCRRGRSVKQRSVAHPPKPQAARPKDLRFPISSSAARAPQRFRFRRTKPPNERTKASRTKSRIHSIAPSSRPPIVSQSSARHCPRHVVIHQISVPRLPWTNLATFHVERRTSRSQDRPAVAPRSVSQSISPVQSAKRRRHGGWRKGCLSNELGVLAKRSVCRRSLFHVTQRSVFVLLLHPCMLRPWHRDPQMKAKSSLTGIESTDGSVKATWPRCFARHTSAPAAHAP